jgi:hypothetical protein
MNTVNTSKLRFVACGLALLSAGCGSEDARPDACASLDAPADSAVAHACSHALDGPFRYVADGRGELTNTHTAYTVELVESGGALRSALLDWDAKIDAGYAFYVSADVELSLRSSAGESICRGATRLAGERCPELARVDVFSLLRRERYLLSVSSPTLTNVMIIVEED